MFYGNITNTARSQFVFDKKYPNRHEMDAQAQVDDVYIGRFILIEYDNDLGKDQYFSAYLLEVEVDGVLEYQFYSSKNTEPETRLKVDDKNSDVKISKDTIVCVPGAFNGIVYNLSDPTNKNDEFWVCTGADKEGNALFRQLAETEFDAMGHVVKKAETNYIANYSIDKFYYGDGRGFDSTVWQKISNKNGEEVYIKIADLNTIAPVFDITADAPTMNPMTPHLDTDSTNIYYNLHVQPSYGLRIKAANSQLKGPTLDKNGIPMSGLTILTSDQKAYPSDQSTHWYKTNYNKDTNKTTDYVFDATTNNGRWLNVEDGFEPGPIPAAIYYNKDGLDSRTISYSTDKYYENWNNLIGTTAGHVTDQISVSPTGKSGQLYDNHDGSLNENAQEDTMELSVMLPSIGDALAHVWDLVYGDREDNKNNIDEAYKRVSLDKDKYIQGHYYVKNIDGSYSISNEPFKSGVNYYEQDRTIVRNRNIEWKNASAVENKEGLRLVNPVSPGSYTYSPGQVDTVAGAINSVHDLMGMIITDKVDINNLTQSEIDQLSDEYIYYDGKKYYRKHKTYDYTEVSPTSALGNNAYVKKNLYNWNNNSQGYWYLDTARSKDQPEYIKDTEYFSDRKYYANIYPQEQITLSEAYEPGLYYSEHQQNIIIDDGTSTGKDLGIKQTYYTRALGEYEAGKEYYQLTNIKEVRTKDNKPIKLYVPGKYYIGTYIALSKDVIKASNYEKGKYYYVSNYTISGEKIYPIFKRADGEYNNEQTYFKLEFDLSNSLERQIDGSTYTVELLKKAILDNGEELAQGTILYIGYKYYELNATPQEGVSDAYYQEVPSYKTVTEYYGSEWKGAESYIANTYYYIDNGTYVIDTDEYNEGVTYYVKTVKYELIVGAQDVDVNEDNTTEVTDLLFNLSSFEGGLYYRRENPNKDGDSEYVVISLNNYINAKNVYYTLSKVEFNAPYIKDMYYYLVNSNDSPDGYRVGSYKIDDNNEKTTNRIYYKSVRAENLITAKYYEPNKYYYKKQNFYFLAKNSYGLDNDGNVLSPIEYYSKEPYYVLSDTNGVFEKGMEWNINATSIPESVTLATRTEKYELQELEGFAYKVNTIHGLILRIADILEANDNETRNLATVQGAINKLNDLIASIDSMIPGQIVIVDEYGKMHSSPYTTAQSFFTKNGQSSLIETNNINSTEDRFINLNINKGYFNPKITLQHNFTAVEDTRTISNKNEILTSALEYDGLGNNNSKGDTLELYTPIVDNMGHIVGKNTEIVTLPFGYKTFNGDTGTSSADTTQSIFTINGDSWLGSAAAAHKISLTHKNAQTTVNTKGDASAQAPKFGETFKALQVGIDSKGHVSALSEHSITIPKGSLSDAASNGADVITKLSFTDTTGALSTTRTDIGTLKLTGYTAPTTNATTAVAAADTINGAFSKVQAHLGNLDTTINNLDLVDTAVTGQFISKINQTNGQIAIERTDFSPNISITDGTASDAPKVNITINSKSGIAQPITKATTLVYGVAKLTDTYNSQDSTLALTGKGLASALVAENIPNLTLNKITDAGTMAKENKDNYPLKSSLGTMALANTNDYIAVNQEFIYPDTINEDLNTQNKTIQWLFNKVKKLEQEIETLKATQ